MMIIRIGLSMVPRGRRWDSSTPMFSTLVMSTIYSSEEESSDESGEAETRGSANGSAAADDPYAGVGRNAPCPCGSGKKFKMCHGRSGAR